MTGRSSIEKIFHNHGYADFRWLGAKAIVVSTWVRMKCTFGCSTYGTKGTCPPNVPSIAECREFFREYNTVAVLHFEKSFKNPLGRFTWCRDINKKLLALERAVFLAGYYKAFLFFMDECSLCKECPGTRLTCKNKKSSRPCPEAFGVDVFATVRKCGYPAAVLTACTQTMHRYAFLMIE